MNIITDPLGNACLDFISGAKNAEITVESNIAEDDVLPVEYLFRSFNEMPDLEKKALTLSQGKILDVGAGAGSHALYLQQSNKEVFANEISHTACSVMHQRGVKNIIEQDFFELPETEKYDTILMLMNGIGIAQETAKLKTFFTKIKALLAPNGSLLIDSSDIRYLFEDDDGSILINLNGSYYGEITYKMHYKDIKGKSFKWLFIDDELLKFYAEKNGFKMEKIADGLHYDYLARLTIE
ncbi:class I SAM-dependent methyltransferase [Saccharicrinis fermentans]|uniref:Putative methyltransferase n=1 Tax=Saccharicrinis fermentans DSM 9555 = JCM 21142 TaxID=869213 RepID=W7YMW6_9BACT|nr:class I SAM-dependent methyltransferase [Saccharicrinis fermentans]GAF03744.1 putative methyltransferase [Saccharicrinis fermentans DSM 9555 = JCM 21142]